MFALALWRSTTYSRTVNCRDWAASFFSPSLLPRKRETFGCRCSPTIQNLHYLVVASNPAWFLEPTCCQHQPGTSRTSRHKPALSPNENSSSRDATVVPI